MRSTPPSSEPYEGPGAHAQAHQAVHHLAHVQACGGDNGTAPIEEEHRRGQSFLAAQCKTTSDDSPGTDAGGESAPGAFSRSIQLVVKNPHKLPRPMVSSWRHAGEHGPRTVLRLAQLRLCPREQRARAQRQRKPRSVLGNARTSPLLRQRLTTRRRPTLECDHLAQRHRRRVPLGWPRPCHLITGLDTVPQELREKGLQAEVTGPLRGRGMMCHDHVLPALCLPSEARRRRQCASTCQWRQPTKTPPRENVLWSAGLSAALQRIHCMCPAQPVW